MGTVIEPTKGSPLAALVQERIDQAYGGNQSAFARAIGTTPQGVHGLVHGKIALPRPDVRRRLARELGIRHIDLFVLAGELWPDEIEPVPEGTRSEVEELFAQLPPDARAAQVVAIREFVKLVKRIEVATAPPVLPTAEPVAEVLEVR